MIHQVLLVSLDPNLADRVRRALPGAVPTELQVSPFYLPAPDPRGWLLVLLDAHALPPVPTPAPSVEPHGDVGAEEGISATEGLDTPMLWFGAAPRITETGGYLQRFSTQIVDYVDRGEAPSKLAFILHQHLAACYLHRMRVLPPSLAAADGGPAGDELRRQLNNVLTGILGNAALAMDAGRRLPAPLGLRLQRISDLAAQMRDLMRALPDPQASKTPA